MMKNEAYGIIENANLCLIFLFYDYHVELTVFEKYS